MNIRPKVEITISNRTVIRVIAIVVVTLLAARFLSQIGHVLELLFISAFLSLALNPGVGWITRHLKLKSRVAATGFAYISVVVALSAFLSLVIPPLVRQTVEFVSTVPTTLSSLNDSNSTAGRFVSRYNLQENVKGLSDNIKDRTKNIQEPVISTASRVGGTLIAIVTVLILTFMMLTEGPELLRKYWQYHPKARQDHDKELALRMYRVITGYVNGQVLLAAIAAGFAMVALLIASTLFHASINAIALAGIVFIAGLIPMIGNTIGGAMVVLACALVSLPLAITMAVFILIYQQVENATFQPYIQAKNNELTPLIVFSAALLGVGFGGLLGAFVAIPAAGCARILLEDFLETRGIGKN